MSDNATINGTATSNDGTTIAYTRQGSGPDLIMIDPVGASRATTPQATLPGALAEHFTVWTYDRRGKGQSDKDQSGNPESYDVQREVEDLGTVIDLASGPVTVYGFSSGATLALIAAAAGAKAERLVLFEPPLFDEPDPDGALIATAEEKYAEGPKALHTWFVKEIVGVPDEVIDQMPVADETLRDVRSLFHELSFLPGTPASRFARVQQPTLVIASDSTAPEMHVFGGDLEAAMPNAKFAILPGEWHGVDDATQTRAIVEFVEAGS